MRFPLSTGMAKNGNFIPVIERNRKIIPGPKGNYGNKGGEYFPLDFVTNITNKYRLSIYIYTK